MKGRGILLDPQTGDLQIEVRRDAHGLITGGLVLGDVTNQNQGLILCMQPGESKEHPTLGVGLTSLLFSNDVLLYKHRIREQLESDGFKVTYLAMAITPDNKIDIDLNASYK